MRWKAFALLILSLSVYSSEYEYLYPFSSPSFNSYGSIGTIQMPNGRVLKKGSLGITYSNFSPYQRITITAYPFDWLEALYQYTDISTKLYSTVKAFSGNQTYKDKGFDIKLRILKETSMIPNVSLGFKDIAGTGLFGAEYIAASKNIRNFDFSLGLGFGALSGSSITNPLGNLSNRFFNRLSFEDSGSLGGEISTKSFFRGQTIGIFGGVEIFSSKIKGLRYKIEYDSTNPNYEGFDPVKFDRRFNFGITFSQSSNLKFSLSSIRGNEIQFGFSFAGDWSETNTISRKRNKNIKVINADDYKILTEREDRFIYLSSLKLLNESEQPLRRMDIKENEVSIAFAQNKYLSYPRSYGRVISLLDQILPSKIEKISLIPVNADMELAKVQFDRESFKNFSKTEDYYNAYKDIILEESFSETKDYSYLPLSEYPKNFFDYGIATQTHIGGPDRFFVAGLHLRLENELVIDPSLNIQAIGRLGIYDAFDVIDNYSSSILPHVRTDIAEYLQEGNDYSIVRLQLNKFKKISNSQYLKFSAGIFEEMFSGYGFEYLYRPFTKNFAIGAEVYQAHQRSYNQLLSHSNYETLTGFINYYYFEPRSKVLFAISGGRFLAKDSGFRFDFSREFHSGFKLGAYFSRTDISSEEFGEGSFDKGFYFVMPLEIFSRDYNRKLSSFGLSPVTRDGAAKLIVGHDLWGVTDQANYYNIMKNIKDLYD